MNENINYKDSWLIIKEAFPILNEPLQWPLPISSEERFSNALNIINQLKLTKTIKSLIISRIEKHIREVIVPEFWSYFKKTDNKVVGFGKFYKAVEVLYNYFTQYLWLMSRLNALCDSNEYSDVTCCKNDSAETLKLIIRATLLSQLPVEHTKVIEDFYDAALNVEDTDGYLNERCVLCTKDNCIDCFYDTNRKLGELGLLEPMVGQVLTSLIYTHIENHVHKTCKDNFDNSYINILENWLNFNVIKWLHKVYCFGYKMDLQESITKFKQKLTNFLYETYTKIRINQLFNIIIEYPESLPALEDLNKCLPNTDLRPLLTKKLQKAMETRLLHPGVSTPDILTAYVASIRSMRVLDPSGLLLETVTQPVHQYLRSREDTVRCVVSSLTEEGPNDLAEELVKGDAVHVDENTPSDEESENWESWVPDPVDVDPRKLSNIRRTSDIISMLVNVYGSKELFVNEYRTLLADRLLSQFSCDTEKEIRYLELLKLRFGDSQLHYCEVMLKDIADSKRINQHIKQDRDYIENNFPMSAMIVSAQFWPPFKDEKLELHSKVLAQMEAYTTAFETLKGSRTLCWKNHLGVVDLEIELPDRILNLSVSPIHATILMYFQDKNHWELDDLSRILHVPATIVRKKIGFWQSHGLLEESKPNLFYLVEGENSRANVSAEVVEDYESESAMASTQDQREEELQTFWSYIIGMLMNLDSLPLERIHQMLKMFAFQGPTIECSLPELRQFLDRKVREHQLVYSGGYYKLPKPDML
ncbi:hypothetical protein ILUMI_20423 [Ignelater luminosus]|uniref:Anaphase-promoting complex subunit 2 n=1 Tax=Ignelater luminosus TaxID=2038154 RepID=A0A8K0FYY2_IGNLU|nr:hypothetical protein ILUMI_20423 [Ignelater luminosus]